MAVAQAAPSILERSNIIRSDTSDSLISRVVISNDRQVGVRIDDRRFEPALVGSSSRVGWYFDKMVMPSTEGVKPEYDISYVPMFYSPYDVEDLGFGFISTEKWADAKVTHVLGFYKRESTDNSPTPRGCTALYKSMTNTSNIASDEARGEALITPEEAAQSYKALGSLLQGRYKIGSPAVVGSNKGWMTVSGRVVLHQSSSDAKHLIADTVRNG